MPWIEQIDRAEPDLLRVMLWTFVQALMGAEAGAICGAPFGARTDERVNTRNGYRPASGRPAPARWSWRSRSCIPDRTSRTGCSSAASARNGPDDGGRDLLPAWGLTPLDGEAGRDPRDHAAEQEPGQRDGRGAR